MRNALWRYCLTAWFMLGIAETYQITRKQLNDLLTPSEVVTLVGKPHTDETFSITHPILVVPDDGKLDHQLHITEPGFQTNFTVNLILNPNVLSKDVTFLETFSNGSYPLFIHSGEHLCYFRGEKAAVSLCNGVKGIIHVDNDYYYVIHPLPKRFHNDTSGPHLLVRKNHNNFEDSRPRVCAHEQTCEGERCTSMTGENNITRSLPPEGITKDLNNTKVNFSSNTRRRKRETFTDGAPAFVETAVFVDRDLFDHMTTNYPVDTERELIRFVLAMVNAVQLLYHDPSLGRPVNFVLKRLEILKEEAPGLVRPPDIDRFLSNFCNWQRTKNPIGDMELSHWDHALILTGLDLYVRGKHGKISTQVVGLAPVAGMCTATSSCTVNEGRHFESVYVVAHEIGHNLGMRHDGPLAENDCDPSSYIMSPTLGSGKITWSTCSKRYLQKFLDSPQSRCLLDHGSSAGQLDHSAEGALPGERFDANQQCMLKYGSGSTHSTQQPLDDVCRDLHCERERYTWTSHPALEGTKCGNNMWCRGGKCISKSTKLSAYNSPPQQHSSVRLGQIKGGWSQWKSFGECASGCLYGEEGRLRTGSTGIMISERSCSNPTPQGGKNCEGPPIKYTACDAEQCLNVPKMTVKEFADQICYRATEVEKDFTGIGMQKISSDSKEACLVWCQKHNGSTKSRGWTFPDGTTCQTRRHRYGKMSYCIKGKCEEFVCDPYNEATFVQSKQLCPSEKNDNELNLRTGLRRREGPVRWKSASGCHYNCISPGAGIRLVMSKKHGKSSIQICQPEKFGCGRVKSPFQHASMVCKKYKERVRRLSGLGMQISPAVEDPDRPCRIACQDDTISHRFYLVNGEEGWFPFGTDCAKGNTGKKSYCISGKCLEFGPDDTPLTESEFTLPLLSRSKRSLDNSGSTRIFVKLNQMELDGIIEELNRTIYQSDTNIASSWNRFNVDLSNPIHVNMDTEQDYLPYRYFRKNNSEDYENYT